jgi:hypothetical protein
VLCLLKALKSKVSKKCQKAANHDNFVTLKNGQLSFGIYIYKNMSFFEKVEPIFRNIRKKIILKITIIFSKNGTLYSAQLHAWLFCRW